MQLPGGRRRPIQQPFRPEGPLVHAQLSDPILVKRAKDGDRQALAALCERLLEDRRASTDADPAREADRTELRGELNRCLGEISPDQARVVVLKDALGLSFEEIAATAGMPVGTAKCYAHRGRNQLREKLSDVA